MAWKQQHLSPHICCGSGTQVRITRFLCFRVSHRWQCWPEMWSSQGPLGRVYLQAYSHDCGRIHFSWAFGQRANSSLAVDQENFQFLAKWASPTWQLASSKRTSQEIKRGAKECWQEEEVWQEKRSGKTDITAVQSDLGHDNPLLLAIFMFIWSKLKVQLTLKGGNNPKAWIPGVDSWQPF